MGKECSAASLKNHCNEITHSSQVRDHCSELNGITNVDVASRIMEDIELESDGEAPCLNIPSSSFSDDEEEEVGGEADCLNSETKKGQMENQLATLEDIRVLFSDNQELAIDTTQNMAGGLAVDVIIEGRAIEDVVFQERGQQLVENDIGWVYIEKIAKSLGFSLIPNEKLKCEEVKSLSVRKKGGKKELQNLRFDVKFKDSELRGVHSTPNEDNDLEC